MKVQRAALYLMAAMAFAGPAHAVPVLIDFESLAAGTVVTNQFSEVTFSGGNVVLAQGRPLGNFICTSGCIEDTILDFTNPVSNLTFWGIQIDATGLVAEFNIFQNGVFGSTIQLFGPGVGGGGGGPLDSLIDLSAFTNVTRLEIVNILNNPTTENGIGWDQFGFDVGPTETPEPASLAILVMGLAAAGVVRRKSRK